MEAVQTPANKFVTWTGKVSGRRKQPQPTSTLRFSSLHHINISNAQEADDNTRRIVTIMTHKFRGTEWRGYLELRRARESHKCHHQ